MSTFDRKKHMKDIGMKAGETRNAKGSTQKVRIIKSPLRKTADSLREVEADAIEAIKKAVKGERVEKDQLETSKWLLGMIQTLDKSASQEEISSAKVRMEAKKSQDQGAGVEDLHTADVIKPRLNLAYIAPEDDE